MIYVLLSSTTMGDRVESIKLFCVPRGHVTSLVNGTLHNMEVTMVL